MAVGNLRRYALFKARAAEEAGDRAIAAVWRGKQSEVAGVLLPATFPLSARLAVLGYTTIEDLDGADECELIDAGLSAREATRVLDELAELMSEGP